MPTLLRLTLTLLTAAGLLGACGGGGGGGDPAAAAVEGATPVGDGGLPNAAPAVLATDTDLATGGDASAPLTVAVADATTSPNTSPNTPLASGAAATTVSPGSSAAPATLQPPPLPRSSLVAADLAVLYASGDASSEAIARAYQRARGIPEAQVIGVAIPTGADSIGAEAFARVKADIDARLPARVQATLLTWTRPSRVQGSCSMGITSALAFGYSAARCGVCARTAASAYYDSDSTRPWTELQIRPSMMLGAATLEAAQSLIDRGLAAEGSAPTGTGWLVRTADAARSVRWNDFAALPAAWAGAAAPALRYVDASAGGESQWVSGQNDLLFYFTGAAKVPQLAGNRFLPGAAADHLTSFGGLLPGANGQMPATAWLDAGATASYGTVEEPCNFSDKFPRASVLVEHYLRGATLIEAYWKSVAWPGQGLFVGEPLARPWANTPAATLEDGALVVRSRALRRNAAYRVDWLAAGASRWQTLATISAGAPAPQRWRVPLPVDSAAGGRLRWVGPCPTSALQTCVLGESG